MATVVETLAASVLAFICLGVGFDLYQRTRIRRRNQILTLNKYFIGCQLNDAIAAIGDFRDKRSLHGGYMEYRWGIGADLLAITTDPEGKIVDSIPHNLAPALVFNYLTNDNDSLIGKEIREIEREIGKSHKSGSFDHGLDCDVWHFANNKTVDVWSRYGVCLEITVRDSSQFSSTPGCSP